MNGSSLTEEQKQRIEENRKKALQKRAEKAKISNQNTNSVSNQITQSVIGGNVTNVSSNRTNFSVSTTNSISWSNKNSTNLSKMPTKNAKALRGSCIVMSKERFFVQVPYHKQLIDIFKSIKSRQYDIEKKVWSFRLSDHNGLMSGVKPLMSEVTLDPIPQFVLNIFNTSSIKLEISENDLTRCLDPELRQALMPFQRDGVCFGLSLGGRVLIADDMGLGKTIQAMAIANFYLTEWPLLIAAPSTMRYSWLEAFHRWMPSIDPQEIVVLNNGKDSIGKYKVYITGYELMTKKIEELKKIKFKVAIMDESHFLKNMKTLRTKAAQSILKDAKRVILLSGTPALSRPEELFTQIQLINSKLFPSYVNFGIRYCNGKKCPWGWDFQGSSNTSELLHILEDRLMIRRLKSDVLKQLPAKLRNVVILDPTEIELQGKKMEELASNLTKSSLKGMERRGELLKYFNITSASKVKAVSNYITDLLEKDQKFLCFAHHHIMMDAICFAVAKKKCKYIRIDGSTTSAMRKQLCDDFQFNDSIRVAVLSITAANSGITLTAAQLVVFAELFWNPGILTQAEDRAHRIGQQDSVVIQYLVAKNTADDYLWSLVQNKLEVLNKVGLSKDSFSNADTVLKNDSDQMLLDEYFLTTNGDFKVNDDWDEIDSNQSPTKKIKYT